MTESEPSAPLPERRAPWMSTTELEDAFGNLYARNVELETALAATERTARAQLAKVRALSSSWRDLGRTDVAYWWSSLADALDAALDPVSATEDEAKP